MTRKKDSANAGSRSLRVASLRREVTRLSATVDNLQADKRELATQLEESKTAQRELGNFGVRANAASYRYHETLRGVQESLLSVAYREHPEDPLAVIGRVLERIERALAEEPAGEGR